MDGIGREEHEEFKQRIEDELNRINHRLKGFDEVTTQI